MDLTIESCDQDDIGTQRCRLGPKQMEARGISVGACVRVQTSHRSYICSAWPRYDGFENLISYDPLTAIDNSSLSLGKNKGFCTVEKTSVHKVSHFTVDVVFKNVKDVKKYKSCVKEGSDPHRLAILRKNILDILRKLYISNNMTVDCTNLRIAKLHGISYIKIAEISSNSNENLDCGRIYSSSIIQVRDVLSYEKFSMESAKKKIVCGGCDLQVRLLTDFLSLPLLYAKEASKLGVGWPHGILVQGPSGSGKSTLIAKVAQDLDLVVLKTDGTEVFGSRPGEGEEKIRKMFQQAVDLSEEAPCVVLIEDVDAMCPRKRGSGKGAQEQRMVTQLAAVMDRLTNRDRVLVVGTTCHPQLVDTVLRRPGRFEKEILLGVPRMSQRQEMLQVLLSGRVCASCVDVSQIAESTPGFVAADLKALVNQAHYFAATRGCTESYHSITMEHFQRALHDIVPSTQRGSDVLVDHRPVSWEDVGGLDQVKIQLRQAVEWPLKHGAAFRRLGIRPPSGVLLFGPPGCAKTLLVRAAASACGATFLAISGAQLHSPFVGDAEKKLTEVFRQARAGAPSILFLDEVDAILGKRKEGAQSGGAHERVLSMLLNELDGIGVRVQDLTRNKDTVMEAEGDTAPKTDGMKQEVKKVDNSGVLVVAATNRPDMVDDALMRPGRLDKVIYVPPPDQQARLEILRVHTTNTPLEDVDLETVAKGTERFTGADLENLCREAALHALSVDGLEALAVSQRHFDAVVRTIKPSLTKDQLTQYAKYLPQQRQLQSPAAFDFKSSPLVPDFNFSTFKI